MGALPLKGNLGMQATLLEQAPPDQLVELLLPHLWASIAEEVGAPELQPVDLNIRTQEGGEEVFRTSEQSWSADGTVFLTGFRIYFCDPHSP